jgi:hypothetical protein
MLYNQTLINFTALSLIEIGNYFMFYNKTLTNFSAPKLEYIGDDFLQNHPKSKEFNPKKALC